METQSADFLRVLENGTVSTNVFLRRFHNFALGMNWLPEPILARKLWPKVRHAEKRAITAAEHHAILAHEHNPARRAYYDCCWHLGGAQTEVAELDAEDIV